MTLYSEDVRSDFMRIHKGSYLANLLQSRFGWVLDLLEEVETNFQNLPNSNEKIELRKRLVNPDKVTFLTAVTELYFALKLLDRGFSLDIHPSLDSTSSRPEYLATRENESIFFEVRSIFDKAEETESSLVFSRIIESLASKLDKNEKIHISIRALDPLPSNIKYSRLVGYVVEQVKNFGAMERKETEFLLDDVTFKIRLRKKEEGTLGFSYGGSGSFEFNLAGVRSAIKKKIGKYGKPGKPYVIILDNFATVRVDSSTIFDALFGKEQITWRINTETGEPMGNAEDFIRDSSGLLKENLNKRLSAVIYHNLDLGRSENPHVIKIIHNPYAEFPIQKELFGKTPEFVKVKEDETSFEMGWINKE